MLVGKRLDPEGTPPNRLDGPEPNPGPVPWTGWLKPEGRVPNRLLVIPPSAGFIALPNRVLGEAVEAIFPNRLPEALVLVDPKRGAWPDGMDEEPNWGIAAFPVGAEKREGVEVAGKTDFAASAGSIGGGWTGSDFGVPKSEELVAPGNPPADGPNRALAWVSAGFSEAGARLPKRLGVEVGGGACTRLGGLGAACPITPAPNILWLVGPNKVLGVWAEVEGPGEALGWAELVIDKPEFIFGWKGTAGVEAG